MSVGRPQQPVHVGAHWSTGPVDRSLLLLLLMILILLLILIVVDFLSLPTTCLATVILS